MLSPSAADLTVTTEPTTRGGLRRIRGPLLLAGGVTAATIALHLRDPHDSGSWGYCPLFLATGLYCPGCGGLRAVNDLTHGDVAAAASSNLLLVVLIPVVVVLWALWTRRRWRGLPGKDLARPVPLTVLGIGVLFAFTIARNLSFGAWLAP